MNENLFEPIEVLEPLSYEMDSLISLSATVKCNTGHVCKTGEVIL